MKRTAAFLVLALAMISLASQALAQQMVPMKGHILDSESLQRNLVGATLMPAEQTLELQITLKVRNKDTFDKLPDEQNNPDSPYFHYQSSRGELGRDFGPAVSDYQAVENWLISQGLQIVSVDDSFLSRSITLRGTVTQIQNAFQVQLMQSADGGSFANITEPSIPANLVGLIGYIGGLSNLIGVGPGPQRISPGRGPQSRAMPLTVVNGQAGFAPSDVYSFYSENPLLNAGFNGAGQLIGIVGLSDFLAAAVTKFDTQFSLPTPVISSILVDSSDPLTNTFETEALLDLEWTHAVAPASAINYYLADPNNHSSNGPIFDALQRAVSDDTCGTISVTFNICGLPLQFYQNTLDPVLNTARIQGQQVFIASGDFGVTPPVLQGSNCVAGTTAGVSELAADPNAIAVGGSQPTAIPTTGSVAGFTGEQVFNTAGGLVPQASGGGASQAFTKPIYQQGLTPNDGQRDIPDLSLLSALTLTNGNFSGVFIGSDQNGSAVISCCQTGTSTAAPLWAGIGAVMEQRLGTRISSNFNTQIYSLGRLNTAAGLRDVTTGNNTFNGVTGFSAVQGYDQATGWGSADITTFVNTFAFGRGLVATGIMGSDKTITSAEIYTPTSRTAGTFSSGGTFVDSRTNFGVSSLADGTILVFGGANGNNGNPINTAGIYDPSKGTFTLLTAQMPVNREISIWTNLLFTGKVFITGQDNLGGVYTVLYDPVLQDFSFGPNLLYQNNTGPEGYTQTLLANGKVLIEGGTAVSQIFDPILNSVVATNGQPKVANRYNASSVLLPDGRVLIAGGDVPVQATATAEVYNPATDSYTQVGNMTEPRVIPPLILVSNGEALVLGTDKTADLFNPSTNSFSATGKMQVARLACGISRLNNGTVLIAGGTNGSKNLSSAEIYDPLAGTFTATSNLSTARNSPYDFAIK